MNPIDAYQMFHAVKLHFTQESYDYNRYHGKVRVDPIKFEVRRDKYQYYKLTKQKEPLMLCVANIFEKANTWIGDLFTDDAKSRYLKRKSVLQSIDYTVVDQMSQYESFNDALNCVQGEYPKLLTDYHSHRVAPETLIIVNHINNGKMFEYWSNTLNDSVVWPDLCYRLLKYQSFIDSSILDKKRWLTKLSF